MQEENTSYTSFKDISPRDEALENDVHPSPKMYLPHKDYLVQGDDIVVVILVFISRGKQDNPYELFLNLSSFL